MGPSLSVDNMTLKINFQVPIPKTRLKKFWSRSRPKFGKRKDKFLSSVSKAGLNMFSPIQQLRLISVESRSQMTKPGSAKRCTLDAHVSPGDPDHCSSPKD